MISNCVEQPCLLNRKSSAHCTAQMLEMFMHFAGDVYNRATRLKGNSKVPASVLVPLLCAVFFFSAYVCHRCALCVL